MAQPNAVRTRSAWDDLLGHCVRISFRARVVQEPGRRPAVDLWPFSQVMHAPGPLGDNTHVKRSFRPRGGRNAP